MLIRSPRPPTTTRSLATREQHESLLSDARVRDAFAKLDAGSCCNLHPALVLNVECVTLTELCAPVVTSITGTTTV
jgi:hypothetical protein